MNLIILVASLFGLYLAALFLGFAFNIIKALLRGGINEIKTEFLAFVKEQGVLRKFSISLVLFILIVPTFYFYKYATFIPDGIYCYKVSVIFQGVEYVLPAEVILSTKEYEEYYSPEENNTITQRQFNISRFYWPNGGYCEFDSDSAILSFDKYLSQDAQDEKQYKIKLLNERTTHQKIEEKTFEEKSFLDLYIFAPVLAFSVFLLIIHFHNTKLLKCTNLFSKNKKILINNSLSKMELTETKDTVMQMLKNENENIKNKIKIITNIFVIILLAVITFFSYFLFKKDDASKEKILTTSSQPTFVEPLTDRSLIIYKTEDNDYYHLDKNCEDSSSYYVAYLGEALDDGLSICPKCESKLLNEAIEVYYTETGTVIHQSLDCQYLKNSVKIYSSLLSDKSDQKKCSKCW